VVVTTALLHTVQVLVAELVRLEEVLPLAQVEQVGLVTYFP
jgi:hypothetical protein